MNQTMRYRAANNQELVEYLKRKGVIKSQRIFDVMRKVDRRKYVNNHNPYNDAYIDSPQNIGNGRTISAPHMHAVVLETLDSKLFNGSKVLTIRCSAGYLSVCMASLVGPTGTVVHVESNPDVHYKAKSNIINDDPSLLISNRIKFILDDELNGYSSEAPYDVIYIGAAVTEIPQKIIDQLAIDGRLLVPMTDSKGNVDNQMLTLVKKNIFSSEGIIKEALIPVRYGILNNRPINCQVKKDNKCLQYPRKATNTENSTLPVPKILETPVSVTPSVVSDNKHLQATPKATSTGNSTLPVPRILETPVSTSPFSIQNTSETNVNNDKLNGNCQKNEISYQLTNNFDNLERKFNELEDAFRKTLKTSSISKQANQTKFYAIEQKYFHLDNEINAAKNNLEQKLTEQCALIKNVTKQLELNLLRINRRLMTKNAIVEKNSAILERKLNKKIAKLKRIMDDKINDEGRLLIKELSVFKVSIEDKLAKENSVYFEKISGELDKRDSLLRSEIKEEMIRLRVEKNDSEETEKIVENNQVNTQLAFYAIITLHTVLAISKIVS